MKRNNQGYGDSKRQREGFEPCVRGAFSQEEDETELKDGVPLFNTKEDALKWCRRISNSSGSLRPSLKHAITTFVGWEEVEKYLIPRIAGTQFCPRARKSVVPLAKTRFDNFPQLADQVRRRLELPHHSKLSSISTANALRYAFFHMRCGILVQIRDNKIKTFAPFVNDKYTNTWGKTLKTDPAPLDVYYQEKRKHYREENILKDPETWWANGNIICNEHDSSRNGNELTTQWWGDNMLLPFKHMLEQVCADRDIPDVDFFFNKRDHPQLRTDPTIEPYDFLFDERDTKIPKDRCFPVLAPFLSFYCSPEFSDLPIPTVEDWKGAKGVVFPETTVPPLKEPSDLYLAENIKKFHVPWEQKVETAFFRGNATGGGVTPDTNQRLGLARRCVQRKKDYPNENPPLLDAGVTGFNVRDKKRFGEPMRYAHTNELREYAAKFTPMYEQGRNKYIVYVEGHCAANRYAFLMRLGSVIIRIESSCTASELWFFPMLVSQDCSRDFGSEETTDADHVLVKKDLSDLEEKLEWCKRNDDICKTIAQNAKKLYEKYISEQAILDYWQLLLIEIGQRTMQVPDWWNPSEKDLTGVDQNHQSSPPCINSAIKESCVRVVRRKLTHVVKVKPLFDLVLVCLCLACT